MRVLQQRVTEALTTALLAEMVPEPQRAALRPSVRAEVRRVVAHAARATRARPVGWQELFRQMLGELVPAVFNMCQETEPRLRSRVH